MNKDDHLQRHLDHCNQHSERLKAEGKWLWPDSQNTSANAKLEEQSVPKPNRLPEETLQAMVELGQLLKVVHMEILADGYVRIDGRYIHKSSKEYAEAKAKQKGDPASH